MADRRTWSADLSGLRVEALECPEQVDEGWTPALVGGAIGWGGALLAGVGGPGRVLAAALGALGGSLATRYRVSLDWDPERLRPRARTLPPQPSPSQPSPSRPSPSQPNPSPGAEEEEGQ